MRRTEIVYEVPFVLKEGAVVPFLCDVLRAAEVDVDGVAAVLDEARGGEDLGVYRDQGWGVMWKESVRTFIWGTSTGILSSRQSPRSNDGDLLCRRACATYN